jgi:hypothetical protein
MPIREVLECSKCGRVIEPEPPLGDRQGCLRRIVHGATTWQIALCSTCVKPLWDLYREYVDVVLPEGTAVGPDKLMYLPRADADEVAVKPPTFSEET